MPLSKIQLGNTGRRNKIINGTGHIAQRSTSAAETAAFVLDRWRIDAYNQDQLALQISQSTDTPSGLGFPTSHLVNINTAETAVANDEYLRYYTTIEARNLQDLEYGGSSPKKLQLSFWVKATGTNVTGTYGVLFWIEDANKYQNATYTISAADTWEKKTIEVGTTGHAAIANDSGRGMRVNFHLMAGSNYTSGTYSNEWGTAAGGAANTHFAGGHAQNTFVQTVGNKWYMTGCQLEVADAPTEFEHLSFAEELALCERYYQRWQAGQTYDYVCNGSMSSDTRFFGMYQLSPDMRDDPTMNFNGTFKVNAQNGDMDASNFALNRATNMNVAFYCDTTDANRVGNGALFRAGSDADAYVEFISEL